MDKTMKIRNGWKDQGIENKKKIRDWFVNNPYSTKAECVRGTGLSKVTVYKHIKSILEEEK
jgi:hypothetical protein